MEHVSGYSVLSVELDVRVETLYAVNHSRHCFRLPTRPFLGRTKSSRFPLDGWMSTDELPKDAKYLGEFLIRVSASDSMTDAKPVREDGAPVADNSGGNSPCKFKVGDSVRSGTRRGVVTRITTENVVGAVTGQLYPNIFQYRVSIPGYTAPENYFVHDDAQDEKS